MLLVNTKLFFTNYNKTVDEFGIQHTLLESQGWGISLN